MRCRSVSLSLPPSPSLLPSDSQPLSLAGELDRAGPDEDVALDKMLVPCLARNSEKSVPMYMCYANLRTLWQRTLENLHFSMHYCLRLAAYALLPAP